MKIWSKIIAILILLFLESCSNNEINKNKENSIITRHYCSEIGRIDLLFYEDEISGSYVLLSKQSLGAIWGKLKGNEMKGRWVDEDGSGTIMISFNEDFSWFTTAYNSDDEPEKWYKDSWHGQLRPNNNKEFEVNGNKYKCE